MPQIHVIGLGMAETPLPFDIIQRISSADVVACAPRLCACLDDIALPRIHVGSPLSQVGQALRRALDEGKTVAFLASGDPLFFGIGSWLLSQFTQEELVFYPGITSIQAACSRIKRSAHNVPVVSLHGRDALHTLFATLSAARVVAAYTDPANSPDSIAKAVLERGGDHFSMWVCQDMGSESETIECVRLPEAVGRTFSALNVVLLERDSPVELPLHLGMPDETYAATGHPFTKWPVRSAILASLALLPNHIFWDLGASIGTVSLEASILAHKGRVYAVERHEERVRVLREFIHKTGALHIESIKSDIEAALDFLPTPDRVFMGGGVGLTPSMIPAVFNRLARGGRITVACVLLGSLGAVLDMFDQLTVEVSVTEIQSAVSEPLGQDRRLVGRNPVFLVSAQKKSEFS